MSDSLMKRGNAYAAMGLTLGLLLGGCGGGGGGSAVPVVPTGSTSVIVQDGNIVGATVVDAAGTSAVEVGNGVYSYPFNYIVQLPVTVSSQNSAATISACMDASATTICSPAGILTFQDLDASGTWTTGDVMYNTGMTINFAPSTAAGTTIYANPITSFIPAAGVFAVTGGLTAAEIHSASTGNFSAIGANIQSTAAVMVAVQEALVNGGANPAAVANWLSTIPAGGANIAAALQAAVLAGTPAQLFTGGSVPTAADLSAAIGKIATAATTAVAAGLAATPPAVNFEAIINVVQSALPANPAIPSATLFNTLANTLPTAAPLSLISGSNYSLASSTVATAITNVTTGTAAIVNGSFIMPIYDVATKTSVPAVTVLDGLTGFSLTYNAASTSITINGTDALLAPAISGKTLVFDSAAQMYGFADPATGLFVSINLNFNGTRLLSVCTDYAGNPAAVPVCTLSHFALPNQAEVCGLQFNDLTFFADKVGPPLVTGHADYAPAGRFTTMNGQTSVCP